MTKMTHEELVVRDEKRDIGAELLESVREMKANTGTLLAPDKEPEPRYEYKFVKGAKVKVRIN